MRDDSAEILLQSFLQETLVSSFGMGRDVQSLTSILHFTPPNLHVDLDGGFWILCFVVVVLLLLLLLLV